MRAMVVREFGGPEVLQLETLPEPKPRFGEVLVRVMACGVCGQELLARSGAVRGFPLPLILGHEIAGIVEAVGEGVQGFAIGARVATRQGRSCHHCNPCRTGHEMLCAKQVEYGQQIPGGYAEFVALDAAGLALVPDEVDWPEASIAACAVGTIVNALNVGGARAGKRVLVTGATGGLGLHALQVARAVGAEVVAITGSDDKRRQIEQFCDAVVVTENGNFLQAVRDRGLQPDIILELTAGLTLGQSARAVARGGHIVIIGNIDPKPVEILPGAWIERKLNVSAVAGATLGDLQVALQLIRGKRIKPVVAATFRLEEAAQAHRLLEQRKQIGRYVLLP